MAKHNPMAGGPAYVEILKRAIQKEDSGFVKPPSTGGTQISLRFSEHRLFLFEELSRRSGWTRTQVIEALIDHGLLALFTLLDENVSDEIIKCVATSVMENR